MHSDAHGQEPMVSGFGDMEIWDDDILEPFRRLRNVNHAHVFNGSFSDELEDKFWAALAWGLSWARSLTTRRENI